MPDVPVIMPETDPTKANVNSTSMAYDAMEKTRELPRALMGGTTAMRKCGAKYLPQEPAETSMAYEIRLSRTVLYNAYRKAVLDLTGKVFSKPLVCSEDVPDDICKWCENIDLAGRDLHSFTREVFIDSFYGVSFILVDFPRLEVGRTLDEERKVGARPYCVHIPCQNVISTKAQLINGVQTLIQARVRETAVDSVGDFGERMVDRVRLFELIQKDGAQHCAFTVHEKQRDKEGREIWVVIPELSGVMSIDFIPIIPVYTGRVDFMQGVPPLSDLADLNALHWRSSSDQQNILHFTRSPLLFGKCLGDNDDAAIEIGPNRMIRASSDQADLKFVEHSGAAIKSGQASLDDIAALMSQMAMAPTIVGKTGTITATEKAIDTSEAHSTLQSWALMLSDSLELMLQYMGAWVGKESESCGCVNINTDYGLFQSGLEMPQLAQAFQVGLLSKQTVWNELKRRGLLADDFDPIEEEKLLDADASKQPGPSGVADMAKKLLAGGTPPKDAGGPTLPGQAMSGAQA